MKKMKKSQVSQTVTLSLLLFCLQLFTLSTQAQNKIKVACIGNSITEGGKELKQTYPQILQELLGEAYEVRNFGKSGRTLLKQGDYPYWNEKIYQEALSWNPDIVIIKLGTNDSKPQNWKFKDEFVPNYIEFVNSFKALPAKPKIYLAFPIPVFETKWGINDEVVKNEVIPAVKEIAQKTNAKIIDLYTPFIGKADLTYDQIHPNNAGAALLAAEVYKALPKKKVRKKNRARK